jgi:phospholipid/cholesterol/gamma-HCH transport system ATP-binding protein
MPCFTGAGVSTDTKYMNPPQKKDTPAPPAGNNVEIRVEELHKAFGERKVLQEINLDIHRGDILAVVGGSGCGKTVLLNHVLGLLVPDRGRILVMDYDAPGEPLRDLARVAPGHIDRIHMRWGMVFQRNALFSGSVLDNIALWLREIREAPDGEIHRIARESLKAVGLPEDDEFLERSHEALSGGMAKRLAVARAVAMDPTVMFYDEPTTGLDPTSSAQIHDLIFQMHTAQDTGGKNRTTVIITHDKDLLKRLRPRTVMLHEGRIYFDGPFKQFEQRADAAIIRPYFELMPALHQRNPDQTAMAIRTGKSPPVHR